MDHTRPSACSCIPQWRRTPSAPPDDQHRDSVQPLALDGRQDGAPRCAARLAVIAAAVLLPHLHTKSAGSLMRGLAGFLWQVQACKPKDAGWTA